MPPILFSGILLVVEAFFKIYIKSGLLQKLFTFCVCKVDPPAASQHQMTMKTEFNIINLRETIMGLSFQLFVFFKSSPFTFSICLSGGYKGGEAPIIAVFRIEVVTVKNFYFTNS